MDKIFKHLRINAMSASVAAIICGLGGHAIAQSIYAPQVQGIGPTDLFQDVVNGVPSAGNSYISGANLAGSLSNNGIGANWLIGGRADDNLWQRATTGASETTTYAYGGPDRFAYWSGTSTAMTVSDVTTAAALPIGSAHAFRMQRTASQTGVVQMCMAQELTSINSYYLQGHTVELDANVYTGANFSGTGLTAYVVYGTSTDEGMQKLSYGLNAGGGGSVGWTGQANATAAVIPLGAVSTAYRIMAVASIPTTETEVGVALCYTPVGTAGTTDALYFSNVELRKADYLSNFVNSASAYTVTTNAQNASTAQITATINGIVQNAVIPAFSRRQDATEATLQYSYFDLIAEANTAGVVQGPAGSYDTTTTCTIAFPLPAPMWKVPTLIVTAINAYNALSATTFKINPTTTPVVLASAFAALQTGASTTTSGVVSFKTTTETQYVMCELNSTASGGGAFAFNAEE